MSVTAQFDTVKNPRSFHLNWNVPNISLQPLDTDTLPSYQPISWSDTTFTNLLKAAKDRELPHVSNRTSKNELVARLEQYETEKYEDEIMDILKDRESRIDSAGTVTTGHLIFYFILFFFLMK